VARVGAGLAHDEGLARQPRQRDARFMLQRMALWRDDQIGVRRKGLGHGVGVLRWTHHHRQVGQVVGQALQQVTAVVHRQVDLHTLVAPRELDQQAGQEIVSGADHRHIEATAGDALELRHRGLGLFELADDQVAVVQQLAARRGEVNPATQLLEQRQPGVGFQLANLRGHGRLRQVQLFGRTRVAGQPCHRLEDLQLAQGGMFHRHRSNT